MPLWSDDKTNEEIQKLSEVDGNSVAYNLHEDLLCVKEDLAKANERVKELENELSQIKTDKGYRAWAKNQYKQLRKG